MTSYCMSRPAGQWKKQMEFEWMLCGHFPAGACRLLWDLLIHEWMMQWLELVWT